MSGSTPWPDGRWHYRRSLASRVAVITTVALGVSIAVMALTAFVVMRQQLMSSLDQSLLTLLEGQSRWAVRQGAVPPGMPNFLGHLQTAPLRRVRPGGVAIAE